MFLLSIDTSGPRAFVVLVDYAAVAVQRHHRLQPLADAILVHKPRIGRIFSASGSTLVVFVHQILRIDVLPSFAANTDMGFRCGPTSLSTPTKPVFRRENDGLSISGVRKGAALFAAIGDTLESSICLL